MVPVLFDKDTKDWTTNGLGTLAEAISCKVTEERNDEYELEMTYPISGSKFQYLVNDNIIYAKAFEGDAADHPFQPFRIYSVSKPLGGKVTVKARHNSYQLSYTPVGFIESKQMAPKNALAAIQAAIKNPDNPFKLSTDLVNDRHTFGVEKPVSVRSAIGGDDGFLDTYGGEVLWDNYDVKILQNRGADHGVYIRYGKNLTDLKQEENIEKTYSAIFGFYKADKEAGTPERKIEGSILKTKNANQFPYIRTYIYDCSSDFNKTVIKGYRVGQAFFSDSEHSDGVVVIKNNYYQDQETVITGYYDGNFFFKDQPNKKLASGYYRQGGSDNEWRFYRNKNKPGDENDEDSALSSSEDTYYIDLNSGSARNVYSYDGTSFTRRTDGSFTGDMWYSNADLQKRIQPDNYKYYSDSNTVQRGYLYNGEFYSDSSHDSILKKRNYHYYIDQTNDYDVPYYCNGSSYARQGGLASDYDDYKAIYVWTGSGYNFRFSRLTKDATNEIQNYTWRYNGSRYEVETRTIPLVSDIDRLSQKYMDDNDFGVPSVALTISYQPLWQTEEYKDVAPIEAVHLCDTVHVIFEKFNVDTAAKVTKTVYNVLLDRYDSIELDSDWNKDKTRNLSGTISKQSNSIKSSVENVSEDLQAAIKRATDVISGAVGGYVKLKNNPSTGLPEELLIMDETDYTKAKNVMRFNKNGIGFSQTGYQGPFTSAWTIDGTFSANWITTGLLTAITMQTASSGLRVVIEGLSSAIKGMSGDEIVNIIDMINGTGADANMLIDAKKGLLIRTPTIGVIDKSYGAGKSSVKKTVTGGTPVVTSVSKYWTSTPGAPDDVTELSLQDCGKENEDVYCTLPVYLRVETSNIETTNGFVTGHEFMKAETV